MDIATPQPALRLSFDRDMVNAAVVYADRAVTRDAMRLHNPHDLNNIRAQIYAANLITKYGEPRFHILMELMATNPRTDPLVYKAYAMIAQRLDIALTPNEQKQVSASHRSVNGAKASAAQQAADLDVDIRAMRKRITPEHTQLDNHSFVMPTTHNEEDFYHRLLASGVCEESAERTAAQFPLTLSRIGQSLGRFNPSYNNPVDFLDLVTSRVLAYNRRKDPRSNYEALDGYVREWRDEVKYNFMGVDPGRTAAVKAAIYQVASEVLHPKQSRRRKPRNAGNDTSGGISSQGVSRYFRDLAEGQEYRRPIPAKSYEKLAGMLKALGDDFTERYDTSKVTLYLQAFMQSAPYKSIQRTKDMDSSRILDLAIGELCTRLKIDFPEELKAKDYLMQKFREDQRRSPDADMYWRTLANDARATTAEKSKGIS